MMDTWERRLARHELHCDILDERVARLARQAADALAREAMQAARERAEYAERSELSGLYSDMFKDRFGVRPRFIDFRTIPLADLRKAVDDLEKTPLSSGDEFDEFV